MPYPVEQNEKFAAYAHPERLVSTEWLAAAIEDGALDGGKLVVVESDEDVLLYETGHIPGAVKIDWHTDLNDEVTRDYVDGEAFAALAAAKGISRDSTVVIYGDKSNWWAAYALWVFTLFGHEDVRLLDGGRDKWIAEGRALTTETPAPAPGEYPVVERNDAPIRAFKEDVLAHFGKPLIDVRSPEEYTGQRTHMPAYPEEGALRGGHIPTAASIPWARAAAGDGTYRNRAELEALYLGEAGLKEGDDVVAYCRIGERSSHTWFALKYLLGFDTVRNYDGSWTEWGNAVRVPIVKGAERGTSVRQLPRPTGTQSVAVRKLEGMNTQALPAALAEIVDDFQALTEPERLQLLLEFSRGLPELPDRLKDHPELMEQVVECQSPLFLTIETEQHDGGAPEACGSSSRHRPRLPPPGASPASCMRDSTVSAPPRSWLFRTTCRNCWASPAPSPRCACAA